MSTKLLRSGVNLLLVFCGACWCQRCGAEVITPLVPEPLLASARGPPGPVSSAHGDS